MTETVGSFDAKEGDFDQFAPENVSPLVAYLASPASAKVSGQVFIVWGKQITVVHGPGIDRVFDAADKWTPDSVAKELTPFYDERTPLTQGYLIRM